MVIIHPLPFIFITKEQLARFRLISKVRKLKKLNLGEIKSYLRNKKFLIVHKQSLNNLCNFKFLNSVPVCDMNLDINWLQFITNDDN